MENQNETSHLTQNTTEPKTQATTDNPHKMDPRTKTRLIVFACIFPIVAFLLIALCIIGIIAGAGAFN